MRHLGGDGRLDGSSDGSVTEDSRGLSTTVTHALAVAITTVLVILLVTAMGSFVQDESDRVTREELEALGARLADDVAAADRLTRNGGSVRVAASVPERLVDTPIEVGLDSGPACPGGGTCLVLAAPDRGLTVRQPLSNRSAVSLDRRAGTVFVRANATTTDAGVERFSGPPAVPATVGLGRAAGSGGVVIVGNQDPVAGFTFAPGNPVAGDDVRFVNDTEDLDGQVASYEWTFTLPNGANRSVGGSSANQSYDRPGVYRATLEVTDDEGETDTVSRRVPVSGLVATEADDFDPNSDGGQGGVNVTFNNTWSDEVEILTVAIDPRDEMKDPADRINELDGDSAGAEISLDVGSDGGPDYTLGYAGGGPGDDDGGGVRVPDDGLIADLNRDGTFRGGDRTVPAGETVSLEFAELEDDDGVDQDADDDPVVVAVRYRVNGSFYVTSVPLFTDGTTTTVTWDDETDWDGALSGTNVSHPDGVVRLDAASGGGLPQQDLRVWLPLNETGNPAEAIDYAGDTEYEFDVRGDPDTGVPGVEGSGTAYEFDGDDDWLLDDNAEENYFRNQEAFTVSMWVNADNDGTDDGLLDTVADGGDGQDDELGLRYDSSGFAGGGEDSFKASVRTRAGVGADTYSYEYESDVQSTDWQHVAMRWEAGEPVALFVDGEQLSVRDGPGATAAGGVIEPDLLEFVAIGRSQKDDLNALWDGRIDEVRIYERSLDDAEVEALATRGGLRSGSIETDWKTTASPLDLEELELGYDAERKGGSVTVTVRAKRNDGSVEAADPVTLSGDTGVREVRGLAGDADEFQLLVEFRGTSTDPSADAFTLGD